MPLQVRLTEIHQLEDNTVSVEKSLAEMGSSKTNKPTEANANVAKAGKERRNQISQKPKRKRRKKKKRIPRSQRRSKVARKPKTLTDPKMLPLPQMLPKVQAKVHRNPAKIKMTNSNSLIVPKGLACTSRLIPAQRAKSASICMIRRICIKGRSQQG